MTQRRDDPPSPSAKGDRGTPIADDISPDSAYKRQGTKPDILSRPLGAADTPLLGGPLVGREGGLRKPAPLRNFQFFCLRSQGHFMDSTAKVTPDLFETEESSDYWTRMGTAPREEATRTVHLCARKGWNCPL
jgi:hypothetical protein